MSPFFVFLCNMKRSDTSPSEIIKKLEKEIVNLDREYTSLLKKKWYMEEEISYQKKKIDLLETKANSEAEKRSMWKKIALVLAGVWAVFLSVSGFDRK